MVVTDLLCLLADANVSVVFVTIYLPNIQGWINDENPLEKASRLAKEGFQTPIDEIDAAARILDPVMLGLRQPFNSVSSASASDPLRGRDDQATDGASTNNGASTNGGAACHEAKPVSSAARVLHYGAFFKDYKLTEW